MIKKYSIRFADHQVGSSMKAEFPISNSIGKIVGVSCVLKDNGTTSEEKNGKVIVGYSDLLEAINRAAPYTKVLGKATISTEEGEVIAASLLQNSHASLNKRIVPVSYKTPFSRLCVTIEENDFLTEEQDHRNVLISYDVDVYLLTRKEARND